MWLSFSFSVCTCVFVVEYVLCLSLELSVDEVSRPRPHRMKWSSIETGDRAYPQLKLLETTNKDLTVEVTNNVDVFYSAEVRIGEPLRTFHMLLDTGSSDFWVMQNGAEMINTVTNKNNMFYDVQMSSSGQRISEKLVNITYGKGAISGVRTRDSMMIGGLTISNQGFLEAKMVKDLNDVSGSATSIGVMDGIWGMSFPALATDNFKPLVDTMFEQDLIEERKFSFILTSNGESGSKLLLGEPDKSRMPLGSVRAPVLSEQHIGFGFWAIKMQSVLNLDTNTDYCQIDECVAIVDSGTTDFGMPAFVFESFHAEISAARLDCRGLLSGQLILCENPSYSGLPTINFTIEDSHFRFTPDDYMQRVKVNGDVMATPRFMNLGFTNKWILGGPWLRNVYTIFDNTDVSQPVVELVNQSPVDHSLSMLSIFLICVGAVGCVCSVGMIVRIRHEKKALERESRSAPILRPKSMAPEAVTLEQSSNSNPYTLMEEDDEEVSLSESRSQKLSQPV